MWILWLTWSLLTCASALLCLTGCLVPSWLKGSVHVRVASLKTELLHNLGVDSYSMPSSLGLYRRCVYPVYVEASSDPVVPNGSVLSQMTQRPRADLIHLRSTCGHYAFALIPHAAWQIGLTLLTMASIILVFLTFFLLLSGCYLAVLRQVSVHRTCQVLLLISGSLVFGCCGIYPIGWNQNTEVQQICGEESSGFRLGRCHIGWAYLTTLLGGFLAISAAALPSLCANQLLADQTNPDSCWSDQIPWRSSKPVVLNETDYKYGLVMDSTGIPLGPMCSRPAQTGGLTPSCTPALAHQQRMGPTTVLICSNMTPVHHPMTQAHSVYSQFTNTSSLEGSSNELGQRPSLSSHKKD